MRVKINLTFIILLVPFFISMDLFAQYNEDPRLDPPSFNRVGKSGWQFLHLPTVARNSALGGIKCGLTNNDVNSVFANPANLVDINGTQAAFSQMEYLVETTYITGAIAKNFNEWGVIGVHFASFNAGDMIRTENSWDPTNGIVDRSGNLGTFTAGDMRIGLSYARSVTDRLSIGGNVAYIQEKLDDVEINNFTFDFGVFFQTGFKSLRFALLARNLGPDKQFTGFSQLYGRPDMVKMPVDFFVGIGYDWIGGKESADHTLSSYFELSHPNDAPERAHYAMEYIFMDLLALRGGYKFNYDEQSFTFGAGLKFEIEKIRMNFDYAYMDYGELENVNMFTVGFGF